MRMFYRKRILTVLCSLLFISSSFSQIISENDSLKILLDQCEVLRVSKPDSAVSLARKTLLLSRNTNDEIQILRAEHTLGYCYYSINNFELALEHLNTSLELARKINSQQWIAKGLNRVGNVYQLKSNYHQAFNAYKEALQLNQKLEDHPEIARTLVNLGTIYNLFGNYQKSIEYFLKALALYENIGDVEGVAWTSLNISRMFNRLGLHEKAMQYAETALNNYREVEVKKGNSTGVTLSLTELGNIYYYLKTYNKALEYFETVLEINTKTKNIHGKAANLLAIGIINSQMGNLDEAENNFQMALALKIQLNDSIDLSSLYRHLGANAVKKGNNKEGIRYLNMGLAIAQKQKLLSDIKDCYQSLSISFASLNNYQKALYYQVLYSQLKDSINAGDIARLEMQYDFDKREKEQEIINQQKEAIQEVKLERQRTISGFIALAFILTLLLAGVIFYYYREKKKINQVLLEHNLEIERQKNEIENQKQEIEAQRDLATRQRDQIADQQRQITDSIRYASRIQNAVLPRESTIRELINDFFIIYKPKNIVSGDFYWISKLEDGKLVVAISDCTGHGVPGAFMSMLGITHLKELTSVAHHVHAGDLLFKLRKLIINSLNQTGNEGDSVDGMDMSLVLIDKINKKIEYAGAYLPIFICREKQLEKIHDADDQIDSDNFELFEIRGNKMPIGYHPTGELPFDNHSINIFPDDSIYMFSDGYSDQFGGPSNSKFLLSNFKKLILNLQHFSMQDQKRVLDQTIEDYRGTQKQVDDILVMGFKV